MTRASAFTASRSVLCLVTPGVDLSRSAGSTDARTAALQSLIADAVICGIDVVQVREPDLSARALTAIVQAAVNISRGSSTLVVVNDRVDIAMACDADGVHLGGRSLAPKRVRAIAPAGFLIGQSVHSIDEAAAAAADGVADYVVAGTVFRSASKPEGTPLIGADGLSAIVRTVGPIPVLAIGGVDLGTIPAVARTGARGFAAIRLFADAAGSSRLRETVARARAAFDTTSTIP